MLIKICSSTSHNVENKLDASSFVEKIYLRTNYIESKIEEGIDMRNQFGTKKSIRPIKATEGVCRSYVVKKFDEPSVIRSNAHVDSNNKTLDNIHSVKVNSLPTIIEHFTLKLIVDIGIDEFTMVRTYRKNDFNNSSLVNVTGKILNFEISNYKHAASKLFVDTAIDGTSLV